MGTSMLSCTVVRGRSFATKYANSASGSCCCVSLLLAEVGWDETTEQPPQQFNETQTEEIETEQEDESLADDYVNLSLGKEKQNLLVAEDENEADISDGESNKLVPQQGFVF